MTTADETDAPSPGKKVGLDLLASTSRFDEPTGVTHGIGAVDLALVAFAVRGRRLLRAAYRLLDAGEPDAASALFRVMSEYLIVGRWLIKVGEGGMEGWALDDLRERRNVINEVLENAAIVGDARAQLETELAETEASIKRYGGSGAALSKRAAAKAGEAPTPGLQTMAREVGLEFAYSFAYRLQSQADAHATPLAIDSVFEYGDPSDPGPVVMRIPRHALQGYDLYLVGAHLLFDIVTPLAERVPELEWTDPLNAIREELQTAAAS